MTEIVHGRLIGVSLGPGDPGLLTREAYRLLQSPETDWTYPVRRKGDESYALGIALAAGLTPPVFSAPLVFPMTHDPALLAGYWQRAAETVLERLRAGRDVLFLAEGDVSTYSTFIHLARTVAALDSGIAIRALSGVPSYNAAAARLDWPLADTDETVAILPASYGIATVERLLADFDTLILLKVKPLLDALIDLLERRGLLASAAFVEKAGTPEERIERDLGRLRGQKVNYLSLVLVKNPDRPRGELQRGCRQREAAP